MEEHDREEVVPAEVLRTLREKQAASPGGLPVPPARIDDFEVVIQAAPEHVFIGEVLAADGEKQVLVVGRPETMAAAMAEHLLQATADEYIPLESVYTPRFDHDWLPTKLAARGTQVMTVLDGPALEFSLDDVDEVIRRLEEAGFEVRRMDAAMSLAEGYW